MRSYLSIFLLITFILVGCGVSNEAENSTETVTESVSTSGESRVIEHAMGTTTIEGTPQRIVVLTNEGTDIVLALGITPVGAVKSWLGNPYFDYIEAEMQDVPVVGDEFQPNLEKIVALKPDLIIGSKIRQKHVYDQLNAIAPTIFSETIGLTWKENLKLYGKALNREEEASKVLTDWNQRVADFKAALAEKKINPTVSLVRFQPGIARIYYKDSFPGQILEELGLARPEFQNKEDFADEVGLESIDKMDGDFLFYFTFDEGDKKGNQVEEKWTNHPLWESLKVVQNDKAYKVNDVYWTTSGGVQSANKVLDDLYQYVLNTEVK